MRLSGSAIACFLAASGFATALTMSFAVHAGLQSSDTITAAAPVNTTAQQAKEKTFSLLEQYRLWQGVANGADKSRARQTLAELAQERAQLLAELAQTDPRAVLELAVSEEQRSRMPAEVQAMLEQRFEAEGTLEARYEDHANGGFRLVHRLKGEDGQQFELLGTSHQAELPHGSRVNAKGWVLPKSEEEQNDTAIVESGLQILQTGGDATTSTVTTSTGPSVGEQKTLVLLVNFSDKPEQPYSKQAAQELVFGQVNDYFQENTYGRTWLSGDVAGWFTLGLTSQQCELGNLGTQAREKAAAAGVDVSAYQRFVYVFPQNTCGFSGSATVGGSSSHAWINESLTLSVMAHEYGHNLGAPHAHSLVCANGTSIGAGGGAVGSTPWPECSNLEYGDGLDVMGWADSGHFNAIQKQRLGWLDADQVVTVTGSGQYRLQPMASPEAGVKALRVLKNINENGRKTWYYLELRQPTGFDGFISNSMMDAGNITNGISVRAHYEGGGSNGVYLLDMTPETNGDLYTRDPALEAGSTFVDPEGLLTITPVLVNGSEAVVDIQLTDQPCTVQAPVLEALPASQQGSAGQARDYELRITNPSGEGCGSTDAAVQVTGPEGWDLQIANSLLTLAPGEQASTTVTVTSPAGSTAGNYELLASAWNEAGETSLPLGYEVIDDGGNALSPVAVDDAVSMEQVAPVTIFVLQNDRDPANGTLEVVGVTQGAKGSVRINDDGSLSYTPARNFKNGDSFDYQISNGRDQAQARVTLELASSGGGGGSNKGKGNNK